MAKFVALFFVGLAFHSALGAPSGDVTRHFDEAVREIQNIGQKVQTSLREAIPDTKQISDTLTSKTQTLATDIENLVTKLEKDMSDNQGSVDDAYKQFTNKISQTLTSLRELSGPDTKKKVDEYKADLERNIQAVSDEFKQFEESVRPDVERTGDRLRTFAEGAVNDFVQAFKTFGNDLEQTVNSNAQRTDAVPRRTPQRAH